MQVGKQSDALDAEMDRHLSSIQDHAGSTPAEGANRSNDDLASEGLLPIPDVPSGNHRPVVLYEKAVQMILDCTSIMETKAWNDKAEALAAWARVYSDERILREAKALKLHAYRQIGRLADAMRIQMPKGKGYRSIGGSSRGAHSLLQEQGFSKTRASDALKIGRMDQKKFDEVVARSKPPSPSTVVSYELRSNPEWAKVSNRMAIFLTAIRKQNASKLAGTMNAQQRQKALEMMGEAKNWMQDFWSALIQQDGK